MDKALAWLRWLDPANARIVWLRASGERWKSICWKVGLARPTAWRHWVTALCIIAMMLNGEPAPRGRGQMEQVALERGGSLVTTGGVCLNDEVKGQIDHPGRLRTVPTAECVPDAAAWFPRTQTECYRSD